MYIFLEFLLEESIFVDLEIFALKIIDTGE